MTNCASTQTSATAVTASLATIGAHHSVWVSAYGQGGRHKEGRGAERKEAGWRKGEREGGDRAREGEETETGRQRKTDK